MIWPGTGNGEGTIENEEIKNGFAAIAAENGANGDSAGRIDLTAIVEQTRHAAGDQLAAAWQLHVERVEQELRSGWKDYIEYVLSNIFDEFSAQITPRFAEAVQAQIRASTEEAIAGVQRQAEAGRTEMSERIVALEAALAEEEASYNRLLTNWQNTLASERQSAARLTAEVINQTSRRLRQAVEVRDWAVAILEGAARFSEKAALFQHIGGSLQLLGVKACEAEYQEAVVQFSTAAADVPAIARVLETREPVAVPADAEQLSESVIARVEPAESDMAFICPLTGGEKAEAVLLAYGRDATLDTNALEHLSLLGELLRKRPEPPAPEPPATPAPEQAQPVQRILYPVSREEQEFHLQAQRFARVQVSEMRLFRHQEVTQGRQSKNLYSAMKDAIDRSREKYKEQFLRSKSSLPDYLHVELIKTIALGDESLLGPDYPGPLV